MSARRVEIVVDVGAGRVCPVAEVLAATTLALFIVYLAGDLALTRRHHVPAGDHSALWSIHPQATTALLSSVATVKTATVLVAW